MLHARQYVHMPWQSLAHLALCFYWLVSQSNQRHKGRIASYYVSPLNFSMSALVRSCLYHAETCWKCIARTPSEERECKACHLEGKLQWLISIDWCLMSTRNIAISRDTALAENSCNSKLKNTRVALQRNTTPPQTFFLFFTRWFIQVSEDSSINILLQRHIYFS